MRRLNLITLISLFTMSLVINGCASTAVTVKEEKADDAKTKEVFQENIEQINKKLDFILGVGDSIEITVYRNDDLKRSFKIDPSGRIMFPLIGDVQTAGRSIFQVRDEMRERLSRYLVNPQITINVTTIQSQKIIVMGEVKNPGVFTLDSATNILEAVAKAGGLTDDGKSQNVLLIRKVQDKTAVNSVNLKNIFNGDEPLQNAALQSGDIVYVPRMLIADVSWFFSHLGEILSPIVNLESGIVLWPQVKDVFRGKERTTTPLSIPTTR